MEYTLWYNAAYKRYGLIDASDCWEIEGLHCGACLDALIGGEWLPVYLEYSGQGQYALTHGWYLCDRSGPLQQQQKLDGLRVRRT